MKKNETATGQHATLTISPSLKNALRHRDFRMQSRVSPTARYFSMVEKSSGSLLPSSSVFFFLIAKDYCSTLRMYIYVNIF